MNTLLTYRKRSGFFSFLHHLLFLLIIGLSFTSCESRKVIVNNLDEKEANEILVFLASKNIDAVKVQAVAETGGGVRAFLWNISVELSQGNEAMALLNQVGLPRRKSQNLLNIFSNVGLVPSSMEQKIRYQAGLSEQIASTIRKIDGVLDADVQLSFPEEDPLNPNAQKQKITASVYVKHNGILDDPNAHLVTRIKRLVAGSVPGLEFDNVTVIGDRARFSESNLGGGLNFGDEEKKYVHVWSMTIAEESLTRFRVLFFSFSILVLLLLLSLVWIIWKFHLILKAAGGIKALATLHPIEIKELSQEEVVSEETNEINKEEKKLENRSKGTDEEIDEI